jgi:hypothetical protein
MSYDYSAYGAPPPAAEAYNPYSYAPPAYGAPPPAYNYPPPAAYGGAPPGGVDEVRTVFITGFPGDVKERELNNLLRFLPGYEVTITLGGGECIATQHLERPAPMRTRSRKRSLPLPAPC